ncbi:MAG: hypothetical protein HFG52_08900 [Lachnospiraceae bacterium]|nr:hypothetical protein [Lachnospiraceae bacterium]
MEISDKYRKSMADFISEYIDVKNGRKYEEDIVIKASIKMLITKKVFTVDEMQKQALKDHSIIISKQFIRECLHG